MSGSADTAREPAPLRGLQAVFGRPAPTRRQLLLGGGHLFALWALAFVQPLLDLLGGSPDFFVARGNTPGDILILSIGFTLIPPLVLLLVEWLVSKVSTRLYYGLHFTLLTLIAVFLVFRILGGFLSLPNLLFILVSLALAGGLAWAIFRFTFVRNLMDILIAAPLVILLLFLFASKTSDMILPQGGKFQLSSDSGRDHPIVLVIFDELGTDNLMLDRSRINARRYPNFGRLASTATWYLNQSTTAMFTPIAVPGILTGINKPPDNLPTAKQNPLSIFSQFGRDREVHVMEPVTAVCPQNICSRTRAEPSQGERLGDLLSDLRFVEGWLVLPPGLTGGLPDVGANFQNFGGGADGSAADSDGATSAASGKDASPNDPAPSSKAGSRLLVKEVETANVEQYKQFIHDIPASKRGLTVMHLSLPHKPWQYDVKGNYYNQTAIDQVAEPLNGKWLVNGNGIATSQARMYVQTAYADHLLGLIRHRLETLGLWDDAVVVVSADHGVSFEGGDVPERRADRKAFGEVVNPVLMVKYPGQKKGKLSRQHSMTLDIVPTIARAVGVGRPYETDGVPLQGPVPDRKVTINRANGKSLSVSVAEMARQRDAAIARATQRLGSGPPYTLGPRPDLVGRPVDPVPAGTAGASLDEPGLWSDVALSRRPLPLFITGTLAGGIPAQPALAPVIAVAVNGVIQGTSSTFRFEGATRFGALTDPAALRDGANRIGIYRAEGDQLIPVGGN